MFDDKDIKIFGATNFAETSNQEEVSKEDIVKAKEIGNEVAQEFIKEIASKKDDDNPNLEFLPQTVLLLSFTVTATFEQYLGENSALTDFAKKSFLAVIREESLDLLRSCSDTGSFSFYYLAFRRDNDIERRIGQTFAMLCSHDGDPIFEDLGEAMFCWFGAKIKAIITSKMGEIKNI
ncbi:MAG: hypothetical protein MJ080_03680 [Clostridia bacterium]|nr:hypothetical protein [Clostridia bacterium]